MDTRERISTIRLLKMIETESEYAAKIGLELSKREKSEALNGRQGADA